MSQEPGHVGKEELKKKKFKLKSKLLLEAPGHTSTYNRIEIERSGGGAHKLSLAINPKDNKVYALVEMENFKDLDPAEIVPIPEELQADALKLFSDQAKISEEEDNDALGGTWSKITRHYTPRHDTKRLHSFVKTSSPVVTIDGKPSNILRKIEFAVTDREKK